MMCDTCAKAANDDVFGMRILSTPLWRAGRLRAGLPLHVNRHAVHQVVRRTRDDSVAGADAVGDLKRIAEVSADNNLAQLHRIVRGDHRKLRTSCLEDDAARGNDKRACRGGELEM